VKQQRDGSQLALLAGPHCAYCDHRPSVSGK
jgi:hypothetical protein